MEKSLQDGYDVVVVVDAAEESGCGGWSTARDAADDARARIAAQATPEQRRTFADVVVGNNGDLRNCARPWTGSGTG